MFNRRKIPAILFLYFISSTLRGETPPSPFQVIESDIMNLGPALEILEDRERKLTIDDILKNEDGLPFEKSRGITANYGYSRSAYWIRFSLKNDSSEPENYTLVSHYALLGLIDLYTITPGSEDGNKAYTHREGGFYRPFRLRSHDYRNPNFDLKLHSGINRYYMRIQTNSPVNIHLTLYNYSDFVSLITRELFSHGVYFGALIVILLYNFFMYAVLKEKNYLYYIFFVFFWLAFSYSYAGYARQYIWPDAPPLMMYSTMTSLGIAMIFISLFASEYLELKKNTGSYYLLFRVLKSIILLSTLTLFLSFSIGATLLIFFALFTMLVYAVTGAYFYFTGNRYIRYFVIGLLIFFLGWIFTGLQETGFLRGESYAVFGYAGTVAMMAFISLSLTDRYNFMKEQIILGRKKMLRVQENYGETLQKKITEKTRDILNEKNRLETFVRGMESELSLARSIREKFILQNRSKNNLAFFFHPAEDVGVDYLDFFHNGVEFETGIAMADVAGHGIHSMFNILILKTISLEAGERKRNPPEMIAHINDFLRKNTVFGFITMIYCVFNEKTGEFKYANAGYMTPYLVSEKEIRPVSDQRGIVMGIMDSSLPEYSERQLVSFQMKLEKKEKIVLYSAGLLRALGISNASDMSPLHELLKKYSCYSADDLLAAIQFEIKYTGTDDVTVVCLEVTE